MWSESLKTEIEQLFTPAEPKPYGKDFFSEHFGFHVAEPDVKRKAEEVRACLFCGKDITDKRIVSKTCGPSCRNKWSRWQRGISKTPPTHQLTPG